MERLETIDGKPPFPGHLSLFLAALNDKKEDAAEKEKKAYFAVRYEMDKFVSKEAQLGEDVAGWKRNVIVKTDIDCYECSFVHRTTISDREMNVFRHEAVFLIIEEKPAKAKKEPDAAGHGLEAAIAENTEKQPAASAPKEASRSDYINYEDFEME